jgi:ribosome maturation factor RimP
MVTKEQVTALLEEFLRDTDYQVAEVSVSAASDILVEVDRLEGVDMDFCAALNRRITEALGDEDYSLEVGSVSLTAPFKTRLQYEKHLGHDVEVLDREGRKWRGQLVSVDEDTFAVDIEVMVAVEGKKRKQKEIRTQVFGYEDVKYTKYDIKL